MKPDAPHRPLQHPPSLANALAARLTTRAFGRVLLNSVCLVRCLIRRGSRGNWRWYRDGIAREARRWRWRA